MPRFYQPYESNGFHLQALTGRDDRPSAILEQSEKSSSATCRFEVHDRSSTHLIKTVRDSEMPGWLRQIVKSDSDIS